MKWSKFHMISYLEIHILPVNTSALRKLPVCVQPDVASMHIPLIT